MSFPEKLKKLRVDNHLSQKKLATELGVSQASINYWERGERVPSVDVCQKISEYFRIPIADLLGHDESSFFSDKYSPRFPAGWIIRETRKKAGVSQKALANQIHFPQQALALVEKGKRKIDVDSFIKAIEWLDPDGQYVFDVIESSISSKTYDKDIIDAIFRRTLLKSPLYDIEDSFFLLNEKGEKKAAEQIALLTKIPEYRKDSE